MRVLPADLAGAEAPRDIFDELRRDGVSVDVLVNNAGVGSYGLFAETDVSPHPAQWGPRGARAAYLDAQKSVSELPDEGVFTTIEGLLAR